MGLTNDKTWRNMEKPALNTSLFDVVLSNENIVKAWKQVKANAGSPGVDGITNDKFPDYLRHRWKRTKQALEQGYYIPRHVARAGRKLKLAARPCNLGRNTQA